MKPPTPEERAQLIVHLLAGASCPHGPPAPEEGWASDCFTCMTDAIAAALQGAILAERERIAAWLRSFFEGMSERDEDAFCDLSAEEKLNVLADRLAPAREGEG